MPLIDMDTGWLAQQTPVIAGWKAEDAAFASYCQQRDSGIDAEKLARFYRPHILGDFEKRYADEKYLQRVEAQ